MILHKKIGDRVEAGESFCDVLAHGPRGLNQVFAMLRDSFTLAKRPTAIPSLIVERIES